MKRKITGQDVEMVRNPEYDNLWTAICRRPCMSIWTKNLFKRDSHKKKFSNPMAEKARADKTAANAKKKEGKKNG